MSKGAVVQSFFPQESVRSKFWPSLIRCGPELEATDKADSRLEYFSAVRKLRAELRDIHIPINIGTFP
jgi:hypothetical protein